MFGYMSSLLGRGQGAAASHSHTHLDVSYITDRIVVVGRPWRGRTEKGNRKNNIAELATYLNAAHGGHYLMWDLALDERDHRYDTAAFEHQVVQDLGFSASAPRLDVLLSICHTMRAWHDLHPSNVAVVHCTSGVVQSGVAVACYLQYVGDFDSAAEAFEFFKEKRQQTDVTIPDAMLRYLLYFTMCLRGPLLNDAPLVLQNVIVHTAPDIPDWNPELTISENGTLSFSTLDGSADHHRNVPDRYTAIFHTSETICGDIVVTCFHRPTQVDGDVSIFQYAFNSGFCSSQLPELKRIHPSHLSIPPSVAQRLSPDFCVDFQFMAAPSDGAGGGRKLVYETQPSAEDRLSMLIGVHAVIPSGSLLEDLMAAVQCSETEAFLALQLNNNNAERARAFLTQPAAVSPPPVEASALPMDSVPEGAAATPDSGASVDGVAPSPEKPRGNSVGYDISGVVIVTGESINDFIRGEDDAAYVNPYLEGLGTAPSETSFPKAVREARVDKGRHVAEKLRRRKKSQASLSVGVGGGAADGTSTPDSADDAVAAARRRFGRLSDGSLRAIANGEMLSEDTDDLSSVTSDATSASGRMTPVDNAPPAGGIPPPPPMFGGPPPPPPPPGFGPPPPPGAGGAPTKPHPSKTMRNKLHVSRLPQHRIQNTIWAAAGGDAGNMDEEDRRRFEELFCASPARPQGPSDGKEGGDAAADSAKKVINILDLRRANNVSIALSRFDKRLTDAEIRAAVLAMDASKLSLDDLHSLRRVMPTTEELQQMRMYKGDTSLLGRAERFFLAMDSKRRDGGGGGGGAGGGDGLDLSAAVDAFVYKCEFEAQLASVRERATCVIAACKEVRESPSLRALLAAVLRVGNLASEYAPGSHGSQHIRGVTIDSLAKFRELKSPRDNRTTLLDFMVNLLSQAQQSRRSSDDAAAASARVLVGAPSRSSADPLNAQEELVSVAMARGIELPALEQDARKLEAGLMAIRTSFLRRPARGDRRGSTDTESVFVEAIRAFVGHAERALSQVLSTVDDTRRQFVAAATFFGEDPETVTPETFFNTLHSFVAAVSDAKRRMDEAAAREAAVKAKGAPSGSGDARRPGNGANVRAKATAETGSPGEHATESPAEVVPGAP